MARRNWRVVIEAWCRLRWFVIASHGLEVIAQQNRWGLINAWCLMINAYDGHNDCGGVHEWCVACIYGRGVCACGAVYCVREKLRCVCMEQCVACGSRRGVCARRDVATGLHCANVRAMLTF